MVHYKNLIEINNAFAPMVGRHDYANTILRRDGVAAIELANLEAGHSVLDLGAGSGHVIAEAKSRVGSGFCVAVDAVQGFLSVDVTSALANKGLSVYPAGTSAQQVHLLRADITDGALSNTIRALPNSPPTFDCIFVLHVLNILPPHQRRQTLRALRQLLSPTGRLIITMSAFFGNDSLPQSTLSLPVQFRANYTEAPGAHILVAASEEDRVRVPSGQSLPLKSVTMGLQVSPNRFWTVAAAQAAAAAADTGFMVGAVHHIGKGDTFGLSDGLHSPTLSVVNNMSVGQIGEAMKAISKNHTCCCIGRILDVLCRKVSVGWQNLSSSARDLALVQQLQQASQSEQQKVQTNSSAHLPANGVLAERLEWTQVGVMVVLSKI